MSARLRPRRGVGLAELLLALAISAALLVATAVAVDAAFKAYRVNQEQSALAQRARLAVHRILHDVRNSAAHQPLTLIDAFANGYNVEDRGLSLAPADSTGVVRTYAYDSGSGELRMSENGGVQRVVLTGVSACVFKLEPMRSAQSIKTGGKHDLLKRATINLTLCSTNRTAGSSESTAGGTCSVSAATMPRRNVWVGERLSVPIASGR